MIVIDSSAVICILNDEPERVNFSTVIGRSKRRLISLVTMLEISLVKFGRHRDDGLKDLSDLMALISPEMVEFDGAQLQVAIDAFKRYGKGVDPAAKLNLGDCVTYALAKTSGFPLLFKGYDFSATDIVPAI